MQEFCKAELVPKLSLDLINTHLNQDQKPG